MSSKVSNKRKLKTYEDFCIICQGLGKGVLEKKRSTSLITLKEKSDLRKKARDIENMEAIERIDQIDLEDEQSVVFAHRKCYSAFTNSEHIRRLQQKIPTVSSSGPSTSSHEKTLGTKPKRGMQVVNWSICVFCQTEKTNKTLFSVSTFNVSDEIIENSKYDNTMRIRLAGISDLIAAEGKYHKDCLQLFKRNTSRISTKCKQDDIAMVFLCSEVRHYAKNEKILRVSEVFERYCDLAKDHNIVVPPSFLSRRKSFTEKIQKELADVYSFVAPHHRSPQERETLMIPHTYCNVVVSNQHYEIEDSSEDTFKEAIQTYTPEDDLFIHLVHVALRLRSDIQSTKGHAGLNVSENDAIDCIPDTLYMFLNIIYGGQELLEHDNEDMDNPKQTLILSVAQDIVYGVSGGQKWTPKHIGLGSSLHQITRSKHLVTLFNKAGHCLPYQDILKIDTALAEYSLSSIEEKTGNFLPHNLTPKRFTHFTADNIDINDNTLDGKNTFHATQVAAWQRGPEDKSSFESIHAKKSDTSLTVPVEINQIKPANIIEGKSKPVFRNPVSLDMFKTPDNDNDYARSAQATDIAFHLMRQDTDKPKTWTAFNQDFSKNQSEVTTVAYLPIIQNPAHDLDTLNTVVNRCLHISRELGQFYTVITVDQALYFKLMDLKWSKEEYQEKLIIRMGGLHIAMNFLKAIGTHMEGSGLEHIWIESGLLGPNATSEVFSGKHYNRGMRSHKITVQAMWFILAPQIISHIEASDNELYDEIKVLMEDEDTDGLIDALQGHRFRRLLEEFIAEHREPNFKFWWQYVDMVSVLLMFTRSLREGIWSLYLYSFKCMLPYFMRYDHINYSRWGTIYLSEMNQLPDEILEEFENGNFVVKRSNSTFNQVDPDQSQEWLNATGKVGGGIIGITKSIPALTRWTLSYNLRSEITAKTREMFHVNLDDTLFHKERTKSRRTKDMDTEKKVLEELERLQVFSGQENDVLQNPATKDLATDVIANSLLNAKTYGQEQLEKFVKDRLIDKTVALRDTIKKNKAYTFASLYSLEQTTKLSEKTGIIKVDRNVLKRIITAYDAGREVNLEEILQHELMPVPVAIAETNGSIRSGNKSNLADALTKNITCPETIDITSKESASIIIDGQALVVAIGKPDNAKTFGDLADVFVRTVLKKGEQFARIDVVFDRYRDISIKAKTREKRTKTIKPIRRKIEHRDVPLPASWNNFISLGDNKADLARFLSIQLTLQCPTDQIVVTAGGYEGEEGVGSNIVDFDVEGISAFHEEADTRLVLHGIHCNRNRSMSDIVIVSRDTDVLVLLVAHFKDLQCKVWMMSGTSKSQKYIPVHEIHNSLPDGSDRALLPFHALTGCDTTSYLYGHSKTAALKIFVTDFKLIEDVGEGQLTSEQSDKAEKFICKIYGQDSNKTNEARFVMYHRCNIPEMLPPTSDAIRLHIARAHYQSLVWKQANVTDPVLPEPQQSGWKLERNTLVPVLMTKSPIPVACIEMIKCSCKTGCRSLRCKCRKSGLPCTRMCSCDNDSDVLCINII